MTTEQTPLQEWANKMVAAYGRVLTEEFKNHKPVVIHRPRSKSDPGVRYKVKQWPNGKLECNCPGFVYRKQCRHTKDEVLV
jgi:ribosomal protein S12